MLSGEMKSLAADRINEFLAVLRTNRERISGDVSSYMFDPGRFK